VRALPSAGITRHQRYRDPLRLPSLAVIPKTTLKAYLRHSRISPNYPDHLPCMPCSLPRWTEQVLVGFFLVRAAFPG